MFALRCISVSLAYFFVLYAVLSVVVSCGWNLLQRGRRQASTSYSADLLFALRVMPFVLSALVTLVVTLPSFLLLEPPSTNEPFGGGLVALGLCGLSFVVVGAFRGVTAQLRTARAITKWLSGATAIRLKGAVGIFRTGKDAPPLTVTSVLAPRVLLSESAAAVLTPDELRTALRHEIAHVRFRDNLKKLFLRICVFPGMTRLEIAWFQAAEMAADDAAVSSLRDALDLAAALIKLSRLAPVRLSPELTTALLPNSSASLGPRLQRLFAWEERQRPRNRFNGWSYTLPIALASVTCLAMTYSELLVRVHAVTEWLMH
jgi:Zn-dependent protease with chaperone function